MRSVAPTLIVLFLAFVPVPKLLATQYYVDAAVEGVGDGSPDKPFAEIQQAASVMKPGDICIIREGIYRETVRPNISGTADRPLVFRVLPGANSRTLETTVLLGHRYLLTHSDPADCFRVEIRGKRRNGKSLIASVERWS
jgi:hypothetical protein